MVKAEAKPFDKATEYLSLSGTPESAVISLSGRWVIGEEVPSSDQVTASLSSGGTPVRVAFDTASLENWDTTLLTFLVNLKDWCTSNNVSYDARGLPPGARRLIDLASAVPERKGARQEVEAEPFFSRVGGKGVAIVSSMGESVGFLGETLLAFFRFLRGKASFRRQDLWQFFLESGVQALPIVSLISVLVGLILAFVGAIQLQTFGAQLYVADLVGIAMVRVMGAIMTGIIMAGRTGAAYAAQLGTMQVNEEIDALNTLGVSPIEFLVLPRMLALTIMMPLLCIYADLMGVLGGFIVGVTMLGIGPTQYFVETVHALKLTNVWIGLFHGIVFGILVALAGCLRGIQCGRSASAVGYATTSAVVTSIISIIVATAIITVICNVIGI